MNRGGITVLELAIGLAITAILVGLATTRFLEMQLRAKRAELPLNATAIQRAEIAYNVSYDEYLELSVSPRPDSALDKEAVLWIATHQDWDAVGFVPDGTVRGNYQVGMSQADHPGEPFLVTARSDLDDDDALCEYTARENGTVAITPVRADFY